MTGCNSTGSSVKHMWVDVGWPQGSMTTSHLQCLRSAGFEFATFECWLEPGTFWPECVQNIANAWAAGFTAGAWRALLFPCWHCTWIDGGAGRECVLRGGLVVLSLFHHQYHRMTHSSCRVLLSSDHNGTLMLGALYDVSHMKPAWLADVAASPAALAAVGVYMFPKRGMDPTLQVHQLLGNLTAQNVKFGQVMLDIEGSEWSGYTNAENQVFINAIRAAFDAVNQPITGTASAMLPSSVCLWCLTPYVCSRRRFSSAPLSSTRPCAMLGVVGESGMALLAVYCGPEWPSIFGSSFTAFSDLPLIYAHYDNVPSFYDFTPYGGWEKPAGKQFWDGADGEVSAPHWCFPRRICTGRPASKWCLSCWCCRWCVAVVHWTGTGLPHHSGRRETTGRRQACAHDIACRHLRVVKSIAL